LEIKDNATGDQGIRERNEPSGAGGVELVADLADEFFENVLKTLLKECWI
jgi:hypothetical protein